MKQRVLISGGNGYVGRELTRLLLGNHSVCVIDNLRTGPLRFSDHEMGRMRFERVDITDAVALANVVVDFAPDVIVHLAAIHYIPECEQDPALAVKTNINGTLNLLLACPEGARFVFASSGAVYKPSDMRHNETTSALMPSDVYGMTKLHGEHYVRYFSRQKNFSAVVVRLFNVIGPGETNPHLLPEIVAQLKAGQQTIRLGNMWPKRDYIHVKDAAGGFMATALGPNVKNAEVVTVNLGTSKSYSVAEIVAKLKSVNSIEFGLESDLSRQRKVDRPHLAADIKEIGKRFGWQPNISIDQAIADLWRQPELTADLINKYK